MKIILFNIGPFDVYSFGIFLALSFILSTFVVWKYAKEEFMEEEYLDAFLYSGIIGLISGRIFYIFFHPTEFGFNLLRYILVRETPGLSLFGGLLGAFIFLWWFSGLKKYRFMHILDIYSIAGCLSLVFIKIGQQLGGAAFGRETNSFLGIKILGLTGRYHPTELYEALILLLLSFGLAYIYQKNQHNKWPEGLVFYVFIFILSFIVFLLEFLKNYTVYLYGLSLKQIVFLLFAISVLIPIYRRLKIVYHFNKSKKI